MTDQPHDSLARYVLGNPARAAAFLRAVLPQGVSELLDLTALSATGEHLIDHDLHGRETDILYATKARRDGTEALIYVLIEHQSSIDPMMAWRMTRYVTDIWSRWRREHPQALKLPVVIPVVLYHGERAWSAARDICELCDATVALRRELGNYLPRLSYYLESLESRSDHEITSLVHDGVVQLFMLMLKYGRSPEAIMPRLLSWIDLLRKAGKEPDGLQTLAVMITYISAVREDVNKDDVELLASKLDEPEAEVVMTLAEQLRSEGREQGLEKGREQGLEKGREQGLEKGREQGRVATLTKLATLKFGELSPAAAERLRHATEPELDRFTERILSATTLEDLFRLP